MTDLTEIPGVGAATADNLRSAGYDDPDDVLDATVDELTDVDLIGEETARRILDDDPTAGRSPTIVDDHIDEIMEHAAKPLSDRDVISRSPIGWSTHQEWLDRDEDIFEEYQSRWQDQRAKGRERLLEDGLYGEADSSLVKYLIKCSGAGYDDEQTIRHEGDGLGDVRVSFTDDE